LNLEDNTNSLSQNVGSSLQGYVILTLLIIHRLLVHTLFVIEQLASDAPIKIGSAFQLAAAEALPPGRHV